jgi:hypothetical protein
MDAPRALHEQAFDQNMSVTGYPSLQDRARHA